MPLSPVAIAIRSQFIQNPSLKSAADAMKGNAARNAARMTSSWRTQDHIVKTGRQRDVRRSGSTSHKATKLSFFDRP